MKRTTFFLPAAAHAELAGIGDGNKTYGLRLLLAFYRQVGSPKLTALDNAYPAWRQGAFVLSALDVQTIKAVGRGRVGDLVGWWIAQGRPRLREVTRVVALPTAPVSEATVCVAT